MESQLPTNYVLIDFENVQPKNLEVLAEHPFKVLVFVGANQAKVPFDLAAAMQKLGDNASYIKITGSGQNAFGFSHRLLHWKAIPTGYEGIFPYQGEVARDCDVIARKALGSPRASSVFPAPAFPVLSANNFEDAKQKSFDAIGKMLSQQAFAIVPKVREVNDYLATTRNSGVCVREVHPEICFWGLNERQAMKHPKKKPAGFEERLQVLGRFFPDIEAIVNGPLSKYTRSVVARDDILDALVALVVASTSADKLKTMPPTPNMDSRGLPMEMVYTEDPNGNAL